MKTPSRSACPLLWKLLFGLMIPAVGCAAGQYQNFRAAVYIPVGVVRHLADPAVREREWEAINRQV